VDGGQLADASFQQTAISCRLWILLVYTWIVMVMKKLPSSRILVAVIVLALAAMACTLADTLPTRAPTVEPALLTRPPTPPLATVAAGPGDQVAPTIPPPPTATATVPPATDFLLAAGAGVPAELAAVVRGVAGQNPAHFGWLDGQPGLEADLQLVANGGTPLARWIYALAAPFATVADDISMAEVPGTCSESGTVSC
jgi:hypothetical protein